MNAATKRKIPTASEVLEQQKRDHQVGGISAPKTAKPGTAVATAKTGTTVTTIDHRSSVDAYLDQTAPGTIVGRLVKFGKEGQFITSDDGEPVPEDAEFVVLADQTLIGWIKFHGEGEPPERHQGLLFDGYVPPARETLGDLDVRKWKSGLDNLPADPWQHQNCLVLQKTDTGELFTYSTSSKTGRRAVGNLLRHFNRLQKTHAGDYPVVRLQAGGFNHSDARIGWVPTPMFTVVGRRSRDSAAAPDTSIGADMNDSIPHL